MLLLFVAYMSLLDSESENQEVDWHFGKNAAQNLVTLLNFSKLMMLIPSKQFFHSDPGENSINKANMEQIVSQTAIWQFNKYTIQAYQSFIQVASTENWVQKQYN